MLTSLLNSCLCHRDYCYRGVEAANKFEDVKSVELIRTDLTSLSSGLVRTIPKLFLLCAIAPKGA